MSSILQTAERSSNHDPSENVIFQRHLVAYKEAARFITGIVLEIGSGEGYGIKELSKKADKYIAIDKFNAPSSIELTSKNNIEFKQMKVPPLKGINDNSIDVIVTFQVIEHIYNDEKFIQEAYRVLKQDGKLILTTPNILMSLSRSPWHIREYTPSAMRSILKTSFEKIQIQGVFGNEKVMRYYEANKKSVNKIRRWDILSLEKSMPRWCLRIPYDILNRFNRYKLHDHNKNLVDEVKYTDYTIKDVEDSCLDFFCIATK